MLDLRPPSSDEVNLNLQCWIYDFGPRGRDEVNYDVKC